MNFHEPTSAVDGIERASRPAWRRLARIVWLAWMAWMAWGCGRVEGHPRPAAPSVAHQREEVEVKIRIIIEGEAVTATLLDTPTARDFAARMPFELRLRDYAKTEKISELPRRLTTQGAPEGIDPTPGDLTYYAPWGNLAIFYRDFGYASGLVRLGRIDSGLEALARQRGEFTARFERLD